MVMVSTSWPFLELDSVDAYAFRHEEVDVGDVKVELAIEDGEEAESEGEGGDGEDLELRGSVKSIRSFESMMSEWGGKKRKPQEVREVGRGGYSSSSPTMTRIMGSGP